MTKMSLKGALVALAGGACLLLSGCGSEDSAALAQNMASQAPVAPTPSLPSTPASTAPAAPPRPEPLRPKAPPTPPPAPQPNVTEALWVPDPNYNPDDSALITS